MQQDFSQKLVFWMQILAQKMAKSAYLWKKWELRKVKEVRPPLFFNFRDVILLQLFQIPNPCRDMRFFPFFGPKIWNSDKLKKLDSHYFFNFRGGHTSSTFSNSYSQQRYVLFAIFWAKNLCPKYWFLREILLHLTFYIWKLSYYLELI